MKHLIPLVAILAVFKIELFFAVSGLVGYTYPGSRSSSVYIIFMVAVFILSAGIYGFSFFKNRQWHFADVLGIAYPALMVANHAVWTVFDPGTVWLPKTLQLFIILGIPGVFAARAIRSLDLWRPFILLTEATFLLMAAGICAALVFPFIARGEMVRFLGGAVYQLASYIAAFCFGGLGYFRFISRAHQRFRKPWSTVVNILYLLLIPAMFLGALINGGRGAFVLMVAYIILFAFIQVKSSRLTIHLWRRIVLMTGAAAVVSILAFQLIDKNRILSRGLKRATEFIKWEGGLPVLDFKGGSSGRDAVYAEALESIQASPWIGYGTLGHWPKIGQPHNFILDLLLQWGLLPGLAIFGAAAWLLWKTIDWKDSVHLFMITLGLYPAVYLLFSGGYFTNAFFWFVLLSLIGSKKARDTTYFFTANPAGPNSPASQ